jgi:hypothetical protein
MLRIEKATGHPAFAISAEKCPVSYTRRPAQYLDEYLDSPGTARANIAVSTQCPDGTISQLKKLGQYVSAFSGS